MPTKAKRVYPKVYFSNTELKGRRIEGWPSLYSGCKVDRITCICCGRHAHWRSGVHFENERLCPWCNLSWDPDEYELDIKYRNTVRQINVNKELKKMGKGSQDA